MTRGHWKGTLVDDAQARVEEAGQALLWLTGEEGGRGALPFLGLRRRRGKSADAYEVCRAAGPRSCSEVLQRWCFDDRICCAAGLTHEGVEDLSP